MIFKKQILVTGATGFLGKHVVLALKEAQATVLPISKSLGIDLRDEAKTLEAFITRKPDLAVHLAGTVGGIGANMDQPGVFFYDNMRMGMNVIHAASLLKIPLIAVGTVCSYPRNCPIPFREENYWDGFPEETNSPYGIAKKSLGVMMAAYRKQFGLKSTFLIPANMYGPGDHFEPNVSHVIPALIKKFEDAMRSGAKEVTCWGTGKATRSFLYAADAARAIVLACSGIEYDGIINLSGCDEVSMFDLATIIAKAVGYTEAIRWDHSKPDGQPRRAIDGSLAKRLLNWEPSTPLDQGLTETIDWYRKSQG